MMMASATVAIRGALYLPHTGARECPLCLLPGPCWQQPCYRTRSCLSPRLLSVCPLKTLLIAFWPHWPRRWRRWSWRRQHRQWDGARGSGQRAAWCMLHAACHWPRATVMVAAASALATASKNVICRVAPAKCITIPCNTVMRRWVCRVRG